MNAWFENKETLHWRIKLLFNFILMVLAVSNTINFTKVVNGGTGLGKIYRKLIMSILFVFCDLASTFTLHSGFGALNPAFLIYAIVLACVGMIIFTM